MVHTLIQVYLNVMGLQQLASRTLNALQADEALGRYSAMICAGKNYALPDSDESMYDVAILEGDSTGRI